MTPYGVVSMFATCALPGCPTPVIEWGQVCPDCVTACGPYLRPARDGQPPLTEAVLTERDAAVAAAHRMQQDATSAATQDRKPNQRCWLCEERRTCTRAPNGWECGSCRQIT
jgi:hypothetical protein